MKSLMLIALSVCALTDSDDKKQVAQADAAKKAVAKQAEKASKETVPAKKTTAGKATADKAAAKKVPAKAAAKPKAAAAKTATKTTVAKKKDATVKKDAGKKADELPLHKTKTPQLMLARNNELRTSVGLKAQKISPELTKAAHDHAAYMARTGAFDHYVNGTPTSRARKRAYLGGVNENIARGQRNVQGAFRAWRNSGGHWANMRRGHSEVGFGYAVSRGGMAYWVTMYGTPKKKPAKSAKSANASGESSGSSTTSSSRSNVTYYSNNTSERGPVRRFVRAVFSRRR